MRDTIVALVAASARAAGQRELAGGADQRAVAIACMRDARQHFMAPDETEAFAGAVAALWELYPDDEALRTETTSIGDRNKVMNALISGVPVDFDALELTPAPDGALGLLERWRESGGVAHA